MSRARRRDYRTELEVDAGVGIADLVLSKRRVASSRELHALAQITPRIAILLEEQVASTITSCNVLASSLGTSNRGARRVFAELESGGLVSGRPEAFTIHAISKLPFENVIAVEAKLGQWRRVLVQAYRNLQFADESWVVLDHACVRPALAQIERFKSTGLGLASIDKTLGLFVHQKAATIGPVSVSKHWQAQAVLAARSKLRSSR